jgi:hypothetical protein
MIAAALGLVPGLRADDVLPVCHTDCAPSCAPACPKACAKEKCNKHCVPTTKTKTVTTVVYGSDCEDLCYPGCSLAGLLSGGCGKKSCDSCQAGNNGTCSKCGRMYTKKYLVIKKKVEEKEINACEVVQGCPTTCCAAPAPCAVPVPCGPVPVIKTIDKAEKLPNPPGPVDPKKN